MAETQVNKAHKSAKTRLEKADRVVIDRAKKIGPLGHKLREISLDVLERREGGLGLSLLKKLVLLFPEYTKRKQQQFKKTLEGSSNTYHFS